jgi:nucleoside-diphosphate-sugar epimerase
MNISVTGGAGYIGSATAEALLKSEHQVTFYDSLAAGLSLYPRARNSSMLIYPIRLP